ncbi:MAG: ATP-grasp domain-containing protein [Myxococcota bacterium]
MATDAADPVQLVLVPPGTVYRADFETIARIARELEPRIRPVLVSDRRHRLRRLALARRRTMVFSPSPLRRFRPLRGRVFQGEVLGKANELRALDAHGIPVPRWALLTEHERPDLSDFGTYVVVKPDMAGRGADVKLYRRDRVRWKPREARRGAWSGNDDRIVQEFIYTDPWPISYRVVTLFGHAILCLRLQTSRERAPLRERYGFTPEWSKGHGSIVSNGQGCDITLEIDRDVIEFAEKAHAAFPEIPLLGTDVVREEPSGQLYVLEVNSGGSTWHFSSGAADRLRKAGDYEPYGQLDGLRVAARVLVDRALTTAE